MNQVDALKMRQLATHKVEHVQIKDFVYVIHIIRVMIVFNVIYILFFLFF